MKLETADFHVEIESSKPKVSRNLSYSNGDAISFSVTLDVDSSISLADLHRQSAEQVIALLQEWIRPK